MWRRTIAGAVIVCATGSLLPVAASEVDLLGTAWLVEQVGGRDSAQGVRSTLEFAQSGQVGGTTGCNQYFGPVSLEGDAIAFGNLASTRKMCPQAEMDQEQRLLQALAAAQRLMLSDDGQTLAIYAGGGEPVLELTRIVEK
jgi:heat shock protein HslJ